MSANSAQKISRLVLPKRGRMIPSRPQQPTPNFPMCDSCILGNLKCVGLKWSACYSCIEASGRCTLITYSDSESDSNTDADVARPGKHTLDPDSDSDVEAVDVIPKKKIKSEDVKEIEGLTTELRSAVMKTASLEHYWMYYTFTNSMHKWLPNTHGEDQYYNLFDGQSVDIEGVGLQLYAASHIRRMFFRAASTRRGWRIFNC
ncbi:hypothetical protein BD769DRAFT_1392269 [Suillus cothurnatus]|nr:hypothetical protein BD769DRAFT_1392269 [Suillus cothurnatus]